MKLYRYGTQFQLGDFHVSWLTIRDVRFKSIGSGTAPVIPAVHIIHERKLQLHHDIALRVIVDLIGELKTKKFMATSDDEFTTLLSNYVKVGYVGKCENHGTKKIERWVASHGGNHDDRMVYKADFR